jgi:F-type H+-transporting ATPase subunit epsilon
MPTSLEIVSPERLLLSRPVDMVVIPASEGDMGVLEGHTPMIVMLRGGTIDLYEGDRITDRLFVSGGFAEVTPERCTVLADEAVKLAEIDRAAVEAEAKSLDSEVAGLKDEAARAADEDKHELLVRLRSSERRLATAKAKLESLKAQAH